MMYVYVLFGKHPYDGKLVDFFYGVFSTEAKAVDWAEANLTVAYFVQECKVL